ncbi:MAG TPA: aminopeptidase [Thermoplasmata archaeon]|nr:aminopeptidase [Thermoplasmata archaeon]
MRAIVGTPRFEGGECVLDGAGGIDIVDIAKQIVRTSLNLTDQDVLLIHAWRHTTPLAAEIAREAIKTGADTSVNYFDDDLWIAEFVEKDVKYASKKSASYASLAETITAEVELGGPEDPKVFDRTKPERMSAMSAVFKEIEDRKRVRKVRTVFVGLGQVTPQRARKYGVSLTKWKRIVVAALGADLRKMAAAGQLVGKELAGARDVRVTAEGTDLTLDLSGREAFPNDGIIDANDIARGALHESLPTGTVTIAPQEMRADGHVTFPSTPLWGRMIRDLRFTFEAGRLVDYGAAKNLKAFENYLKAEGGDKDRIGALSIGLNPKASYLGGFVDHLVAGAVSLGIGANDEFGGANKGSFFFASTLSRASVRSDRTSIVEGGKLRV